MGSQLCVYECRAYLGERVLERRNRGKHFGETDQHVGASNDPHADVGGVRVSGFIHASGGFVVVARRTLEQEVLEDTGVQHGNSGDDEASEDTLDGREVDSVAAQGGVDEFIHDGDEDQDRDRVQVPVGGDRRSEQVCCEWRQKHVLDEIVGCTVQSHGSSHGTEITIALGVA